MPGMLERRRASLRRHLSNLGLTRRRSAEPTASCPAKPHPAAGAGARKAPARTTTPSLADAGVHFVVSRKELGNGAYGVVLLGADVAAAADGTPSAVAVKILADGRMKPVALEREVRMLRRLSGAHPSLLGFYGHYGPGSKHVRADGPLPLAQGLGNSHCLVMELARGGEIFERVVKQGGFAEDRARPIFTQLCEAVRAAHRLGIVHRDLKLENVLLMGKVGEAGEDSVKLADWGLAHQHAIDARGNPVAETLRSRCGSRSYMAPEVADRARTSADGAGYDGFLADVWSLGVCLFAMVLGFFPFESAEAANDWRARRVIGAQAEGRSTVGAIFGFYPRRKNTLSPSLVALLDRMLLFEPGIRANLDEVLASEWMCPPPSHRRGVAHGHRRSCSNGSASSRTSALSELAEGRELSNLSVGSFRSDPTDPPEPGRQDSNSTAYSASSVGSSVVLSNQRLRALPRGPCPPGSAPGSTAAHAAPVACAARTVGESTSGSTANGERTPPHATDGAAGGEAAAERSAADRAAAERATRQAERNRQAEHAALLRQEMESALARMVWCGAGVEAQPQARPLTPRPAGRFNPALPPGYPPEATPSVVELGCNVVVAGGAGGAPAPRAATRRRRWAAWSPRSSATLDDE